MKIITKTNEKIAFAEEMNESLANAIRRSALEIPVLAIDEVEFHKNDSVLYDEVLALRLGLIPLKMEKDLELKEDCKCKGKGCSNCMIELKLVVKGPKIVYAKDLKGKAEAAYPDMPLVMLKEEQEIELIATAVLGKGKYHTKFSPGLVYYRNAAELKAEVKNCEDYLDACPRKVLKCERGKLELADKYQCDLCEACVELGKKLGDNIQIIPDKEIVFFIESFGQMKAGEILESAVKALNDNLKQLVKA